MVWTNDAPAPQMADIPIGPRGAMTLRPNADSSVQFTPNIGSTNYTQIDDSAPDYETSYVEAVTGNKDLYGYSDLSFAPADITGVMLNTMVENPNPGTITYQPVCKSNTTESDGSAVTASPNYNTGLQYYGQDPDTSAAWTQGGLNAALFGVKSV